jgi:Spy/CpxP family protein refolding chaperone
MFRLPALMLLSGLFVLSGGLMIGQDTKKDDPKAVKKDEPPTKVKGMLPQNWGKIGLSDDQKQQIYKIQGKYSSDIDKLEAKIRELKGSRDKEMKAVLSTDQKKKLDDIVTGKNK